MSIGPVPCEEDCAQVGQEKYRERAIDECKRFIQLLRKTFGDEPPGARLAIGRRCAMRKAVTALLTVAVLFTSAVHTLEAKPKKVPRIGYLFPGFPASESRSPL